MQQYKFDVVYFGTVVRDGAGNIVGIYPTDQEAHEMMDLLFKDLEEDNV